MLIAEGQSRDKSSVACNSEHYFKHYFEYDYDVDSLLSSSNNRTSQWDIKQCRWINCLEWRLQIVPIESKRSDQRIGALRENRMKWVQGKMAELHLSPSVKQKIVDERKNTAAEAKIVLKMLSTSAGFPVQLKHRQKRCPTKVIRG